MMEDYGLRLIRPSTYRQAILVILSFFGITEHYEYLHDLALPSLLECDCKPQKTEVTDVTRERPILCAKVKLDDTQSLDINNVHLKSRLPSDIPGQKEDQYTWKIASC